MFSADIYVKAFIDGNWLSVGILLVILRAVASQFRSRMFLKLYMILNNAFEFIRPSSKDTEKIIEKEKENGRKDS